MVKITIKVPAADLRYSQKDGKIREDFVLPRNIKTTTLKGSTHSLNRTRLKGTSSSSRSEQISPLKRLYLEVRSRRLKRTKR
jgi:hypothetical protein